MITSLLYIFLGLGVIILIYKIQYIRQEKKIKKDKENEIEIDKNIRNQRIYYSIDKNNINEKQNLSAKYNVGTYRDKKGRFRSLKAS